MKKYIVLAIIILNSPILFSQINPQNNDVGNRPVFDDGSVSGYIFDKQSKTALEGTSVQLLNNTDSSIAGGSASDAEGYFNIENIQQGRYKLSVNLTGYNKYTRPVDLTNPANKKINLDTIFLSTGTETEEIVVESERPFMEMKGEKKIFNVDRNMSVKGGTAIDVLKNLPSVTVDIDNNVSLRGGSNIKYFINGRPVTGNITRILEQMPADQLSSVEVITNPSAKFEAEGSTGVINLVLKTYDDSGINGQIDVNSGTGDKYGTGFNLNYKNDKYKLLGSYDYRLRNMDFNASVDRQNFFSTTDAIINQTSDGRFKMDGSNFRTEIEYYLSKSDVLNLNGRYDMRKRERGDTDNIFTYDINNSLQENSKTVTNETEKDDGYSLGLNYNKLFKDPKENLYAEISYSKEKEYENEDDVTEYIYPANQSSDHLRIDGSEINDELNIQTDYAHMFSKVSGLETGLKFSTRDTRTGNFNYIMNDDGAFVLDSTLTDDFNFYEKIGAGYAIFSSSINDFSYTLGMRAEHWDYQLDQNFFSTSTSRNMFDFFPSVSLTQKLGSTEEISFNYSRKVRRPGYRELSPVVQIMSPVFYSQGNPNLAPEYLNSFEISFAKFFNTFSVIPSVFYKITNDNITRISTLIDSSTVLSFPVNADNETSYGTELLINGAVGKVLNMNASFSYFRQNITSDSLGDNSTNTFSGRLFTGISLPWDAALQLTYFYTGERITPQGSVEPVSSFDVGLRKDFFDKKLSMNLRVSDIFNNGKFTGTTVTDLYTQSFSRQRESRVATLSLTYKFGSDNKSDRKKRRTDDSPDDGGDTDF